MGTLRRLPVSPPSGLASFPTAPTAMLLSIVLKIYSSFSTSTRLTVLTLPIASQRLSLSLVPSSMPRSTTSILSKVSLTG